MTTQVDVWIGGASGDYQTARNWYDENTQSIATAAPGANDYAYFPSGSYSITGGGDAAALFALGGAHVTLGSAGGAGQDVYRVNLAGELYGTSLTINGAGFYNETNLLFDGATLDTRNAQVAAKGTDLQYPAAKITTLWSSDNAGNFLASDGTTQLGADALGLHPGPQFVQTGGFDPHESFYGGGTTEALVLPDLRKGIAAPSIQLAFQNQSEDPTAVYETYGKSNSGYDVNATHQFTTEMFSYEIDQVGTVTPITTKAGSFSTTVSAGTPVGDLPDWAWHQTALHIYDQVR